MCAPQQILQGLPVAQAALTERWPYKVEKALENHLKKITTNFFFVYIF